MTDQDPQDQGPTQDPQDPTQDQGFVIKAIPPAPRRTAAPEPEPRAKPRRGRPLGASRLAIMREVNNNAHERVLTSAPALAEALAAEFSDVTIRNTTHALIQEGLELGRHPDGFMYHPLGWSPAVLPLEEARLIQALAALPRAQRLALVGEFGARLGIHDLAEQASPDLPTARPTLHIPLAVEWDAKPSPSIPASPTPPAR